jgi:hypothetical protein
MGTSFEGRPQRQRGLPPGLGLAEDLDALLNERERDGGSFAGGLERSDGSGRGLLPRNQAVLVRPPGVPGVQSVALGRGLLELLERLAYLLGVNVGDAVADGLCDLPHVEARAGLQDLRHGLLERRLRLRPQQFRHTGEALVLRFLGVALAGLGPGGAEAPLGERMRGGFVIMTSGHKSQIAAKA